jgi:hypothetical protein
LCGEIMGVWMGIAHDFTLAPAHAHLNLLGWVTLALYGQMHRAYPALAGSRLARVQCGLAIASSALMPVGIALTVLTENPALAIVASLGVLISTLMFLVMFARKARV